MDFSKFKLEVYDLLGLILPGFLAVCEGWILLRGWQPFVLVATQLTIMDVTLLMLFSFAVGSAIQEVGDLVVKQLRGERYLLRARDRFWATSEGDLLKKTIKTELGHATASVDAAFDYCLTKVEARFAKREIFIATSDFSRSLVILTVLGVLPALRVFADAQHRAWLTFTILAACAVGLSLLMWRRMVRYRELSEITVFRIYMASDGNTELKG